MLKAGLVLILAILLLSQFDMILKFLGRALAGMVAIFLLNFIFNPLGIGLGMNLITLLVSGMLGFYGVVALYAVQAVLV